MKIHTIFAIMGMASALVLGSAYSVSAQTIPVQRKAHVGTAVRHRTSGVKKTVSTTPKSTVAKNTATSKGTQNSRSPVVEVGLLSGSEVHFTGLLDFQAQSDGKTVDNYKNGSQLSITRSGNQLLVNGKKAGGTVYFKSKQEGVAFSAKGNRYRGQMKAVPSPWGSGITLVNVVSMEDYLQGVVPCEIVPSWRIDAIKAQAVAARTYAMFHKNGYRSSGYDVTDDTRSQVYQGAGAETEATNRAVRETAGEIVTYGGKPIDAVFHSSGGGYTENCENVWGSSIPYLKGVPEEKYASPWTKTVSVSTFVNTLAGSGFKVKGIKLSKLRIGEAHTASDRGVSGRVKNVTLIGKNGNKTISGDKIQSLYDLNSTLFDISIKGNTITLTGYGYGHGLGLSQWGAEAMAEKQGDGKEFYKKILTHYYSGTKVEKVY